jgi:hypothetical protein
MSLTDLEYAALRQAIASRGTVRVALFLVTIIGWAVLAVALLLVGSMPLSSIFSLAVLAAGFEGIHALHVGVERIGRYIQVYYEGSHEGPRWETAAMAVGPALPGGGIDPLFTFVFVAAALMNLLPALAPEPTTIEIGFILAVHVLFVVRVARARVAAARQRTVELESFRAIQSRHTESKT